jgi:hypothetical protein
VQPPSGKHIAQMFLVPFLIVSSIVVVIGGILWFVLAPHPPEYYLKGLRNTNTDVRWRTAEELANVLPRNDTLATDPEFALQLTELLKQWLDQNKQNEERGAAARVQSAAPEEGATARELDEQRNSIKFVIQSLGHFYVPVAAPLLADLARAEGSGDVVKQRRVDAVWALANLGERCHRYAELPAERRQMIESALAVEAGADGDRGRWARAAQECLKTHALPQVDDALERCANDPDLMLRKLVAVALTYWDGPHAEATLARLAEQPGQGGDPESEGVRGLEVRFQATAALAQRGSPGIDHRLDVLAQMLDPEYLGTVLRARDKDGKRIFPDRSAVQSTIALALQSLVVLHQKRPDLDLSRLGPALDRLAADPNFADQARAVRQALARK